MMELKLIDGKSIYIATSEIVAFKPAGEGETQVVIRQNPYILDGSGHITVKQGIGPLRDAYTQARRS